MREIVTHKGNELDDALRIEAHDKEGQPGGACHTYWIIGPHGGNLLDFQTGPAKESGVNGISIEALLAISIDRLEGFQRGAYANDYNGAALAHLQSALGALKDRTRERQARGVEGTSAQ